MISLTVIKHFDISNYMLDEVIKIKSAAWDYDYDKQLQWIGNNISDDDIHLLLNIDDTFVAYMNLIDIEFLVNNILYKGYGIGNVCSIKRGVGYGDILMHLANDYLKLHNKIGILFCKKQLIDFYKRNNWVIVDTDKIHIHSANYEIYTMLYNYNDNIRHLIYNGNLF